MLTETQTPALLCRQLQGYTVHSIPASSVGKAGEGILLAVKQRLPFSISHSQLDQPNGVIWLTLKSLQLQQPRLTIGVCYIPPASVRSAQLQRSSAQARFSALAAHMSAASAHSHVLLAGDFNARVGTCTQPWVSGLGPGIPTQLQNTDATVNAHGRKLLRLCEDTASVLCTGRTALDMPAQPSFKARSNTQPSRLDHVIVDADLFHTIQSCAVGPARAESDHLPLQLHLELATCAPSAPQLLPTPLLPAWRWDSALRDSYAHALQSPACQSLIAGSVGQACAHQHEAASSQLHSALDTAAHTAGLHRRRPCPTSTRPMAYYPWFNSRCASLRSQFRHAQRTAPRTAATRLLGRQYQTQLRHSRAHHNQQRVADLSQLLKSNPRKFWQQARLPHTVLPQQLQQPSAWDGFIANLTAAPAQLATQLPAPHTPQPPVPADSLNQPLTLAEVEAALQRLHNGRSGAMLGYTSELLRYAKLAATPEDPAPAHLLAPCLLVLFNAAFSTGQVPLSWKSSLVTPIFKKGDATDTANYRPIAVGEPISRLYAGILAHRLVTYTEEQQLRSPTQTGYRPDLGTIHQAFALQHVIDKHRHAKQPLYLCFVDLKSAYDKVQWPLLWQQLQRLGIHGDMLGAIQSLYDGCLLSMRVSGACGSQHSPSIGLRQGCPLSATLFGIFIDGLHHHLQTTCPDAGIQIGSHRLADLEYADDISLAAGSPLHLQALIDSLSDFCHTLHMDISIAKTKVMVVSSAPVAATQFTCNGHALEQVDSFKYLGLHFHSSGDISHLISPLKAKATGSWAVVQRRHSQLQCGNTVSLKLQLLQSILVPTIHYGCELWGMHSPQSAAANRARSDLEQTYARFLRHVCGVRFNTPSSMLLTELGLTALKVFWWQQTLQFYNRLAATPHGSFFHTILLDNQADAARGARNFCGSVFHSLRSIGYHVSPSVTDVLILDAPSIIQLLHGSLQGVHDFDLYSPRSAPSAGVLSCTYHHWFRPYSKRRRYCHLPVSARRMQRFLQFRLASHKLPIAIHRLAGGPRVNRADRICTHCGSGSIADEFHLVFECNLLQPLRQQYASLFTSQTDTMRSFFGQRDHMQVFKFILDCLDCLNI